MSAVFEKLQGYWCEQTVVDRTEVVKKTRSKRRQTPGLAERAGPRKNLHCYSDSDREPWRVPT
jgi:hypothetical protein